MCGGLTLVSNTHATALHNVRGDADRKSTTHVIIKINIDTNTTIIVTITMTIKKSKRNKNERRDSLDTIGKEWVAK